MNQNHVKRLQENTNMNLDLVRSFFGVITNLLKQYSEQDSESNTSQRSEMVLDWMESIKRGLRVFLADKIKTLSSCLIGLDLLQERLDAGELENRQKYSDDSELTFILDLIQGYVGKINFVNDQNNSSKIQEPDILSQIDIFSDLKLENENSQNLDIQNCIKNAEIKSIPCLGGEVSCTLVSKNLMYFLSLENKQKIYRYNIDSSVTKSYKFEEFKYCLNINYNATIDRIFVIEWKKGVYSFQPGREDTIQEMKCFNKNSDNYLKSKMVFYGYQGLFINRKVLYYSGNLIQDDFSVKLDLIPDDILGADFLDTTEVVVLYKNRLVIINLDTNKVVNEFFINVYGDVNTMSIDNEKERIAVGYSKPLSRSNATPKVYLMVYKIQRSFVDKTEIIQKGDIFCIEDKRSNIIDLKFTRIRNQLMIIAIFKTFEQRSEQLKLFYYDESQKKIEEIQGVPNFNSISQMYEIYQFENSFVIGGYGAYEIAYLSF